MAPTSLFRVITEDGVTVASYSALKRALKMAYRESLEEGVDVNVVNADGRIVRRVLAREYNFYALSGRW